MSNPEDNLLGRQLEPQLQDIFNDFNKILVEKYGFSDTRVVSFTVQQEISSGNADTADNLVPAKTTCDDSHPPRCKP